MSNDFLATFCHDTDTVLNDTDLKSDKENGGLLKIQFFTKLLYKINFITLDQFQNSSYHVFGQLGS